MISQWLFEDRNCEETVLYIKEKMLSPRQYSVSQVVRYDVQIAWIKFYAYKLCLTMSFVSCISNAKNPFHFSMSWTLDEWEREKIDADIYRPIDRDWGKIKSHSSEYHIHIFNNV